MIQFLVCYEFEDIFLKLISLVNIYLADIISVMHIVCLGVSDIRLCGR